MSSFEQHKESLLDWIRQHADANTQWYRYASSYDPLVRRLFDVSGRIKFELHRRRLFGGFKSD